MSKNSRVLPIIGPRLTPSFGSRQEKPVRNGTNKSARSCALRTLLPGGDLLDGPLQILWIVACFRDLRCFDEALRFLRVVPFGLWLARHRFLVPVVVIH